MIAKWLNYTIKFNFTSGEGILCATKISAPKERKYHFWMVLAENWFAGAQKIGEKQ